MITLGASRAHGVYQEYYVLNEFPTSPTASISWIGSLQNTMLNLCGIAVGILSQIYDTRVLCAAGSFVMGLAFILASFSTEIWQLTLTQGLLYGCAASFPYILGVTVPLQWIKKSRGLALAVVYMGSGLGGMWISILTRSCIDTLGRQWSNRILGCIMMVLGLGLSPLILARQPRIPPSSPKPKSPAPDTQANEAAVEPSRSAPPKRKVLDLSVLRDWKFLFIAAASFFSMGPNTIPYMLMPTYVADVLKETSNLGSTLVTIINVSGIFGRFAAGMLSDRLGPINMLIVWVLLAAFSQLGIWLPFASVPAIIASAALFGVTGASIVGMLINALSHIYGVARITYISGMIYMTYSISSLLVAQSTSLMLDTVGHGIDYTWPIVYSGMLLLVAFVILLVMLGLFYHYILNNESNVLSERPDRADNDSTGDRRKYGVVIDAGSSGSRVMIYAWDKPELQYHKLKQQQENNTADSDTRIGQLHLPMIERASEHWTFKTSPGISSFADRPRRVGVEHIKPLLDFAQEQVPKRQMAETPVFLLATAGMRLLAKSHRAMILDTACSFARANYEFLLPDCQESFQVVSGEAEGLYGWIAVNYLLDGFRGNQAHVEQRSSHGFLDMGGASAQIAFEPAKLASQVHQRDLAEVTLRSLDGSDMSFNVFVATFLGHGTNEARRRYVDQLRDVAKTPEGATTPAIDDPCLPPGLTLPTVDGHTVLRGSGSFSQCVLATEPLLNKTSCPVAPCLFAGVHAPEIDFGKQSFVGVSEYWYASHDYLGLGGVWDVDKFESQASKFCQTPWADVLLMASGDAAALARLQMQCFKAAWLVNVLHKGFGVPRDQHAPDNTDAVDRLAKSTAPFRSVNQVGDVEVSWTLGALLLKVSQTISPAFHTIKAKTVPGIRMPDIPGVVEEDVELVDDSLWSPLRFVGLRHRFRNLLFTLVTPKL
ncbi:Golgi apyrase [Coemansia sp. RSA 1722]|nr:Golgi apyrase [Coemansia sp. RSA 1722]